MAVQINVAANQAALTASIQAGVQAYNQRFAQNNQLNLTVNQRAFSQPLGRMTGDVKDFEAALAASNARVIAFGASTAVLGGVIRSFKELANVTIDVEKNLADINRVFGLTTSQLQKFSTDLFSVGKQTASTFDDASKAALEFSRQGLKAEDVLIRTKDALTLTRLAGISTANAVDALTSTVNGFATTGVTTTQILNKLVAVEQDYAVGAGDLAEALSRTGQAAQEAGVSLDQLNALVTSAQQSTARGGAVIGNALKTIFTRLQRTDTLDQLEAFNISVRDVQGNILPAVQILQNFAGAYKNLADAQRAQLSEQVAGVYQVNILKAIVGDLNKSQGVYAGALQRGASATNEAEVATAKLNQTLDALLKQTATSTQQLANNIGKVTFEPLAKYGTEQLKSFVESMNEVLEGEGVGSTFANGLLKGIRNVIAGPGAIAAFFTLFKLIQNSFTYLGAALPQIAGITTETQNRKNIEQSILQIMQQQGPASQALAGLMGNQAAQAQLLLQIARQQTAEYQMQTTLAKQLSVQLASQGVRVKGSGGLQVTRAGGYIPNATRMAEVVGAQAGGYTPGRVVSSPVGGVMNTAEDVKYIPGFAQPFINPPAGSKAGRAHRQNAISRTGVDPYMANGFVPNFAKNYPIKNLSNKTSGGNLQDLYDLDRPVDKYVLAEPVNRFSLPYTIEEYNKIANDLIDQSISKKANITTFTHNGRSLKNYLSSKFDPSSLATGDRQKNLNHVKGALGEIDTYLYLKNKEGLNPAKLKSSYGVDFAVKSNSNNSNIDLYETKTTASKVKDDVVYAKALTFIGRRGNFKNNSKKADVIDFEPLQMGLSIFQPKGLHDGFIPNFAPPTSAIRIPWFKKFGNPAFDAIQPALGISKASDVETFRQINFKSTAEGADERGDSNIFAPLFEDFAFKAMQLVSQPDVKDDLIRGYILQPKTNQKQSAFDAALEEAGVGIEYKGYPKKNLPGSITGELTRKYETLSKSNPAAAAKLKELIIAFNEVGHENQITSELGKKFFGPLAGTSYSEMVKNSPHLVKGLSAETNSLLNSYVKNPAFLAMASANGFIPNFAYKQAVMGLEESMSGNKAIFDTKPFPHIRNSSQPTFSSAIADHGGLGNALSDSMRGQKAAGLMSKGFIPNFADFDIRGTPLQRSASVGGGAVSYNKINKAVNDYIKSIDLNTTTNKQISDALTKLLPQFNLNQQSFNEVRRAAIEHAKAERQAAQQTASNTSQNTSRFAKFSENLSKASTAISIAGPMLAGFAEQIAFGDKKRTDMTSTERGVQSGLSTGLSAVSTGAGIGASFGLPGAIIGGVAGALVGLTSALNATTLSAEELAQLNQEQAQKSQASISAASSYIEAQKSLTQMISSGASSSDIEIATKKLSENFNEIKDVHLQEIFNATGGDVKKMTEELQKYTNETTKKSAIKKGLIEKVGVEDRVSALSTGLDKEQKKSYIAALKDKNLRELKLQKQNITIGQQLFADNYVTAVQTSNMFASKEIAAAMLKNVGITPENDPNYESNLKAAMTQIMDMSISQMDALIAGLEKADIVSEAGKAAVNFKQAATRSFNQIFLDMEQTIAKSAFDVALNFEKNSGSRKVQSAILDFSMSFQDSLNSFISNNLPDARKFDFTAATAGQKAEMLLQKSQQDYNKAIAEQDNERANFLNKNSENLTKEFKASFLPSQASAEFYQNNILPQIQKGTFAGNAQSLAEQFKNVSFEKAKSKFSEAGLAGGLDINNITSELDRVTKVMEAMADAGLVNADQYKKLQEAQKALIDLQNQTALFDNKNEMTKMQNVLDSTAREKELFDLKQANAKKELDINKQLNEARIAVDKQIAVEKAKVDKENLMRMEKMKDLSANIGNTLEITKANMNAQIGSLQRQLDDPRKNYYKSSSQISARKFEIQDKIFQKQRDLEDATIKADIQQRILQMAAEQENTEATLKLNDTINSFIESQLKGSLGGEEKIKQISSDAKRMGAFAPANIDKKYGSGTYAQLQALQRIQESRVASAANNTSYNTSKFSANMEKAGFNKVDENGKLLMTQEEQLVFLSNEELKARKANNVVLEGTIRRYKEEIVAKDKSLAITRKEVEKRIALDKSLENDKNSFGKRLNAGFGKLSDQADNIIHNLAEELPMKFADNMSSALMEVAKGTKSIGDAFQDMAINFGQMIMQEVLRAAIAKTLGNIGIGSLFGQEGGSVSARGIGYQQGGVIRANNGQYVSGMGSGDRYPAMLENGEYVLNRKAVQKLGGKRALDEFNFKQAPRFASGGNVNMEAEMALNKDQEMDYTKNLLYNRSNIGAINENDYTAYAYAESDYFKKMREKAIADEQKRVQEAFAKKQKNAQLISSLVGMAGSLFLAAGMSGMAKQSAAAKKPPVPISKFETATYAQKGGMIGFNSGGFVPHGSRLSDTIPALLTGGEYVMNNAAVRKYGLGTMNTMNAGAMSNSTNTNSTSTNNNTNNNSTNISINIDRSGKATYGSDTNSYEKNDIAFSKQMAKRVADIAKGVISDETRYGGKIYQR
jgi:TP901 family phage tail tape measure protein